MTKLTEAEIKKELFEQWLDHPVTKALMEKAARSAESYRKLWEIVSWSLPIDELPARLSIERLAYWRGKSSAFKSFTKITWNNLLKDDLNEE